MQLKINIPENVKEIDIAELIKEATVQFGDKFQKPEPCITVIEGATEKLFMNYGGISGILGKQKSRKTFLLSLIMSAAIKNGIVDEHLRGHTFGKTHFYIDTEQSRYYVNRIAYRICRKLGLDKHPDNLKILSVKGYSPEDRVRILEYVIDNTEEPGLIILDTLHRFIYDFNDLKECIKLLNKLLALADRKNCHFACVLHINPLRKGDEEKPRGHLGTELQNLAESTILISKHRENKNISVVTPRDFRDIEINEYWLCIDQYGIPYLTESENKTNEEDSF
jgi:hypothetical protein